MVSLPSGCSLFSWDWFIRISEKCGTVAAVGFVAPKSRSGIGRKWQRTISLVLLRLGSSCMRSVRSHIELVFADALRSPNRVFTLVPSDRQTGSFAKDIPRGPKPDGFGSVLRHD